MVNPKKTDQELVALANTGDSTAMEELYLRYRGWVYSLSFRFCQSRQDSLDVLQEVFIYFINKFPGFELKSKLKSFLYPVVRNICLDHIRKSKRVIPLDESYAQKIPAPRSDTNEDFQKLFQWIEDLPEEEQEFLLLRFYDECSLEEISLIQDIPLGTVKSRLHRMLSRLKQKISKHN
jgi:RNA polymerase sigma-70 factor (ECF subfamily)